MNKTANDIVSKIKGRPVVIGVVGRKGGCRKTSTAHMICQGAAMKNLQAVLALTDGQAKPTTDRRYSIVDVSDPSIMEEVFGNIEANKDSIDVVVIDGGGNRQEFDKTLSSFCDLIITPTTIDDPSLIETKEYLDRYSNTFVVVSGYSYNWGIKKSGRQQSRVREILGESRIIAEVTHLESHTELTQINLPDFSRNINNACKKMFSEVLGKFKK
jgi:MinD-like ATPase involved in chromosome partitioning or flagellar assembly